MKLLSATPTIPSRFLQPSGLFTLFVLCFLGAIEFFGRRTTSDWQDAIAVVCLLFLCLSVFIRHRLQPLGWVSRLERLGSAVKRGCERFTFELGLDLRLEPPIPRRLPGLILLLFAGLTAWLIGAVQLWAVAPDGWRTYAVQGSYLVYIIALTLLWGFLSVGIFVGTWLPFVQLNSYLTKQSLTHRGFLPRRDLPALVYVAMIAAASVHLPIRLPLAVTGLFALAAGYFIVFPPPTSLQFLWRKPGTYRVWSIPAARLVLLLCLLMILAATAVILTSAGGKLLDSAVSVGGMPLTTMGGTILAWLLPGLLTAVSVQLVLCRLNDPISPPQPRAHLMTPDRQPSPELDAAAQVLTRLGWETTKSPESRQVSSVGVMLVDSEHSEARELEASWPIRLALDDLTVPYVQDRLERRSEIILRREILWEIGRLFKSATAHEYKRGQGYWLAPHLWAVPGLCRDENETKGEEEQTLTQETIGPPYHTLLTKGARRYFYRVCRALAVDLIFVEDGIDHHTLRLVLKRFFEVYDRHAGQRQASDDMFQGVPKIRVIMHDYQIDEPFESPHYPEPQFENLSRARIMHIFRDRGEQEEVIESPFDALFTPTPLLMS